MRAFIKPIVLAILQDMMENMTPSNWMKEGYLVYKDRSVSDLMNEAPGCFEPWSLSMNQQYVNREYVEGLCGCLLGHVKISEARYQLSQNDQMKQLAYCHRAEIRSTVLNYLRLAIQQHEGTQVGEIPVFNDSADTTFDDVRAVVFLAASLVDSTKVDGELSTADQS